MQNKSLNSLPWFFFAAAFQSLIAIVALLRVPSEGLSLARLALLGVMAVIVIGGIGSGLFARRNLSRFERFVTAPVILSSALLALTFGLVLFLLRYLNPERLLPYYERMSPLLWLFFFILFEATIYLLVLKNGFHFSAWTEQKPVFLSSLPFFAILLLVLIFISITKIGVTPDTAYWGEPGVAIDRKSVV